MKKYIINLKNNQILLFFLVFISVFIIYLTTLAPTVTFIDSGELITCCKFFYIPHPTGYPLYIILNQMFIILSPLNVALTVNIFSALTAALAASFISLIVSKKMGFIPAIISALIFSFHPIVWDIANVAEVYALSALLICFYLFLIYINLNRYILLIFFLSGLFLGNHLFAISVIIPVFLILLKEYNKKEKRLFPIPFILALFGISIYLILYFRSFSSPFLDWGGVSRGLPYLFKHISGKQYQVWMFSQGLSGIVKNLTYLLSLLFKNIFSPLYILSIPGAFYLYKKNKKFFFILIFSIIINLFNSSLYEIPDISSYLIPTIISLSILSGFGIIIISKKLNFKFFPLLLLIITILPILFYYNKFNKQQLYLPEDNAKAILNFLPDSAVFFNNAPGAISWDEVSPIIYLQEVVNYRKDVLVIDKELLRRSWYIKSLNKNNPDLSLSWAKEIAEYLPLLEDWENSKEINISTLQFAFENLINSIIRYGEEKGGFFFSRPSKKFYSSIPDTDLRALDNYNIIPYGFFFTIDENIDDSIFWQDIQFHNIPKNLRNNIRVQMMVQYIKQSVWRKIYFIVQKNEGKIDLSIIPLLDFILSIYPDDSLAIDLKNKI